MEFFLQKYKEHYVVPDNDDDSYKKSLKIEFGDIVKAEKWTNRNYNFHKKYYAMLNKVIYHLPEDSKYDRFRNIQTLRKEIMFQIGRFDTHETLGGKITHEAHSISFKSMEQDEFEKVYSESIDVILKYLLKDISQKDFEKDILRFI